MNTGEFARIYQVRGPQLMWLLGAGASANAGSPTAEDMILEFKASLYASQQKVSLAQIGDLAEPRARAMLQRYFDTLGTFPPEGADEEYAAYFEEAYSREADRQRYIDERVRVARASFGHLVLGAFLAHRRARHAWTTNMDRCIEDGFTVHASTTLLVVADLGEPAKARRAIDDGRLPVLGKLHGDYQSQWLKNTGPELAAEDEQMRAAFVDAGGHGGLVVAGYSGRDRSVMDALREAASQLHPFPAGLFWVHRGEHILKPAVIDLIATARAHGAEAEVVEAPTFDELMGDLFALQRDLPGAMVARINAARPVRLIDSPIPEPAGAVPIVRSNAFPIIGWPTVVAFLPCTRVPTWRELREATGDAPVLVAPASRGVVGFGADSGLQRVLSAFRPGPFDLRPLDPSAMTPNEHSLLTSALTRGLAAGLPLTPRIRRTHRLLIPNASAQDPRLGPIGAIVGPLTGVLPISGLAWAEGVEVHVRHALGRLFLLVQPITSIEPGEAADDEERKVFVNARYEKRYNQTANKLLDAWRDLLLGTQPREMRALGLESGTDAVFCVVPTTAFSYRMQR
jgi:hypothetical protein